MFQIDPIGDKGLRIQLGETISKETNEKIRSLSLLLEKENISGIVEWIPTYTSLSIYYDPYYISYEKLKERIGTLAGKFSQIELPPAEVMHFPVFYGEEMGPDLSNVAKHNGLTEEEVIEIHTGSDYLIFMMGFTPGFPYLGGMSEKIATPRLAEPRLKIPVGSVGIAGSQTGVYSMETPGGWQLIGRTPLELYDPTREKPILLQAGNYIRFVQVSKTEYIEIDNLVKQNKYHPHIEPFKGE
ncbi:5-oxoprolinase subunit PxpB [Oceanobacillus senegalensis]|uniref:5-oxoprolinase subunit PxpB n=1 Tax=Oceanobacillus senegalensis TaxID=1936063 RepID=UPI000A31415C|nr:5-oxoprolinase subunit PxpB [Oceanobacillus senegalensis]